jgi:hypothetical protein
MAGALTAAIASIFSGSAVTADPYYEYTTLLLPGSGTNGAQNNTFLDGSTNNFTITRNGNTTQGTFSPFSQTGWGNYFGGSGNYLKVADGTALDLPGDFTLEGWFYFSSLSSNNGIIGYGSEAASQNGFSLYWAASTVNKLRIYSNGATLLTGTTTLSANTWNHIAIVRSGSGSNNLTVYVNGAVDQTATTTTSFTGVAALGMGIGINYDGTFYNPFTGYASNVRLVKGQALATGAFTPPTSPVTTSSVGWTGANAAASLTGTVSVLTCQSNRFVDNSASPLTITVTGSPSVQAFSPFNPTASWSAATYGGSGYFDGSGDYLSVANSTSLQLSNADWTIECWVYVTSTTGNQRIISQSDSNYEFAFYMASGALTAYSFQSAGTQNFAISMGTLVVNQWYHIAATRSGSTIRAFVNGSQVGSATFSGTIDTRTGGWKIGSSYTGTENFSGYITDSRIVKGTAVYTAAFTPPTAPLTAITNTSLLLNFTNAGIYDATSKNDLETVGNAQISNTTAKFGSTSMYFDGTGDWLLNQSPIPPTTFGSGDFSIEMWIYATTSGTQRWLFDGRIATPADGAYPAIYISSGNVLVYYVSAAARITGTTTITTNTWHFVQVIRTSGTTKMYLNGTQEGSNYTDSTVYANPGVSRPIIGAATNLVQPFTGYIQDLRVTTGYARPTTTPTAAFPTL